MRHATLALAAAAGLLLAACSSAPEAPKKEEAAKPETAPEKFNVRLETSKGDVEMEVTREWAPKGVDHFYTLVKTGFYNGARFFRVRPGFVVQFGINGDPKTNRIWSTMNLPDDPVKQSNTRGMVTYATAGPNTRTTQIFINLADTNKRLDKDGFAPFAKVTKGMDVVESFYSGYGEMAPRGQGVDTDLLEQRGDPYLETKFPRLDFIKKAAIY